MENNVYEAPKMIFVNTQAKESIADECWSYAKKEGDDPLYYDTPGEGYVKFSVFGSNNCSAGNKDIKYTITSFIKPNGEMTDEEQKGAREAFDVWFEKHARPDGSSFKGDNYSEGAPGTDFS